MSRDYDAVVVGARCAGAPTAMLLAQKGHRVLLVDRATFPSDTLSTLVIHAPGVAALDRWGLLDEVVATGCPPIDTYTFDFGPFVISGRPHPVDGGSRPPTRRAARCSTRSSSTLPRAPASRYAGLLVDEIVIDDGEVVGIRGHVRRRAVVDRAGQGGRRRRRLELDRGPAVGAEQYNTKPVLENAFYTLWSGLPIDELHDHPGDRGIAAIPTNDELTLVLVGCPFAQAAVPPATSKATTSGRSISFRSSPNGSARPAESSASRAAACRTSSACRTVRAGHSSATPATPRIRSPPRASATPSATPNGAPPRSTRRSPASARSRTRWATTSSTRDPPPFPSTSSPPSSPRSNRRPARMQELLAATARRQEAMDAFVSVTAGAMSPVEFLDPRHVATILGSAA